MGRKTETIQIGRDTYQITQLGAVDGLEIYHDLIRAVGPSIRSKLGSLSDLADESDEEKTKANVGSLIIEIMENIPKELMRALRIEFTKTTKVKSGELMLQLSEGDLFDQHFAGRYSALTQWLIACLKHNFLDFLSSKDSD